MPAQRMHESLIFQRRADSVDDYGNTSASFADQFTEPAELIVPRLGSEVSAQARLGGQQPVTIRLRLNPRTVQIQADWRAVSSRNPGVVYALTAPPVDREQTRRWLEV